MTIPRPDLTGRGTPESFWLRVGVPGRLPARRASDLAAGRPRVVVLAPHPDDEVLGCGGTLAVLAQAGAEVHVVAVTDGESSHPGRAAELRDRRVHERADALGYLSLEDATVHRLGLPDGSVQDEDVVSLTRPLVTEADLLLAPWDRDGHPDHDATGRAAARLPGRRLSYLVWAWHWAVDDDLPLDRAFRIHLGDAGRRDKERAVAAFASQLTGDAPILPPHVLERLVRPDEVLIEEPR
ncbi:MAG TPA: PIG-L family deacetylase [Mycobacteriales bacterium]